MGKSEGAGVLSEPESQVLIDEKAIWEDHILNQVVKIGGQQEQISKVDRVVYDGEENTPTQVILTVNRQNL